MEKERIDDNFNQEKTEDFTEIFETSETIEKTEQLIINTDSDFENVVKRRDYKGKVEMNDKPKKRRLKKWVYVVLVILLLVGGFGTYKLIDIRNTKLQKEQEEELIKDIASHYSSFVKVSKEGNLYTKENNTYEKIGTIYEDATIELDETKINVNTKYFKIKDSDYYIEYDIVSKSEEKKINERYKKYLPFNINIVTNDSFTMYLEDKKLMTINKSMEFPVIINNYNNTYYVVYGDKLVGIKKDDVNKTIEKENTTKKNQSKITTLAYHRVYDTGDTCTDGYVCLKKENFDKQMKYLKENNYFTLNLDELYMYLKGNLQIEKGVAITIDDGYLFKATDEVLDKYGLNATMFVISGDFKEYDSFKNLKAIDIQSHTHKMHKNYVCAGGNQGGKMLCAGKDAIIEDLKTSLEALGVKPIGLAFPFYDYNETAISALKEVGFKMSFIGRAGVLGKATPKVTDVYKIPRMTVWEESLMSFNTWKSYL